MLELLSKPLVVVTGKGGVGKSTVAAALGLAAAARGKRTIIAEVSARDDVWQVIGDAGQPSTFIERRMRDRLHHISIDPESALEEYLHDQLPRGVSDLLAASRLFSYLAAATPGLRELLTIGKVWELAQERRRTRGGKPYDLVILDAPATGHGVAVLAAPKTFAQAARVGPVARQGSIIHGMLADPEQTAIVAVARPEEMPVNETLSLERALRDQLGQRLAAVIVNGMLPDRFSAAENERLAAAPPSRAVRAARTLAARSRRQRAQAARLRRGLAGVPVRSLPFLFTPTVGAEDLDRLARELARS
jgi:anion-transporting  ArsA/GET3 family ATPase